MTAAPLGIAQALASQAKVLRASTSRSARSIRHRAQMHGWIAAWRDAVTMLMVTHDIKEAFALGTRLIVLDKWRDDPHAQERFGAVVTYDLDLARDSAVPVLRFSKPLRAAGGAGQAPQGAAA
jgi:NitT/TauT family transport system ATP-binding protein